MESTNKLEATLRGAIEEQVFAFSEFSGKNYLLDSLLENIKHILIKFPVDSREPSPVRKKIKSEAIESLHPSDENASASLMDEVLEVGDATVSGVFTTDVVVLKIMSYLSECELKTCRMMNKGLNSYATNVLARRKSMHVQFRYCPEASKFFQESRVKSPEFELSNFTTFLKNCPNFPCYSYSFKYGSLCVPDLQKFLNIHGSKVKELSLDAFESRGTNFSECDKPTLPMLRKLLFEQVLGLNSLELKQCPEEWNSWPERIFESSVENIYLPKLKSLIVNHGVPRPVFGDLLKACSNLQELKTDVDKYAQVIQAGKLHLMTFYHCLLMSDRLEFYTNLPYSQFRCKEIWLDIDSDELNSHSNLEVLSTVSSIVSNLLEANSLTLKSINLHAGLNFLPRLEILEMPEVSSVYISLSKNAQIANKVFPSGFKFAQTFPKLTEIILDLVNIEVEDLWMDWFDNFEPVKSVKYLVLQHVRNFPLKWMNQISVSFPNINILEVNRDESVLEFDSVCPSMDFSLFKHLKFNNFCSD